MIYNPLCHVMSCDCMGVVIAGSVAGGAKSNFS